MYINFLFLPFLFFLFSPSLPPSYRHQMDYYIFYTLYTIQIFPTVAMHTGNTDCKFTRSHDSHVTLFRSSRSNPGLELPSEGPPLEQVSLNLIHEVVIAGLTSVMCPVAGQLMVCTSTGAIHRISWNGVFDNSLEIHLSRLPFSNDLYPETRGG